MIGRTWREKAAHHAGLIDGVLVAWRNGFYSNPSQPRQPLEPFDGSLKILRESLLEDKEFFAWANGHIIQPLEKYDWTEEHAHRDVGAICKCIRHLVDRLRNGGAGTDLVSDLEVEHTSDSEGKNVADIGGMSDFWKLLTPEQLKRWDPLWRLKGELVHNRQKEKAPTPEEVWDEDELSIDDLALLADKSKLRDFLYDLEMLDRTINLQSGDVPANEQKEAVEIARKIRDLVAGIGKQWEKYAQDAFVSQIEGKKAGVRMYSVCESLRVRIDQAREGLAHVDSRARASSKTSEGISRMQQKCMLASMPKSIAILDRFQNADKRWPWRLENGDFEVPPWLQGTLGESSFRVAERCLLWLFDNPTALPPLAPTAWKTWETSDRRPDPMEARAEDVLCALDVVRSDPRGNEIHRLMVKPSKENIRLALVKVGEVIVEDATPKVLHAGSTGENAAEPMKKDKGKRVDGQIVQAVRELAEWGRIVCATHLPACPSTVSLSIEARQLANSNWKSTCIALIPICPLETLSVLRTWNGITEPISRLINDAINRYKGPMLPDTLRQVDEWLALEKIGAQQVTDTKQEQPNLPASEPNSEQIVETQARNGKVEAVVDASRKAESRGEPSPRQEYFGLNDLLERYPKVKDAGAGPRAVLHVLLSNPLMLWSQNKLAKSDILKDAIPGEKASATSVGRWLKVLAHEKLAESSGAKTAKRWQAGVNCRK